MLLDGRLRAGPGVVPVAGGGALPTSVASVTSARNTALNAGPANSPTTGTSGTTIDASAAVTPTIRTTVTCIDDPTAVPNAERNVERT